MAHEINHHLISIVSTSAGHYI